MTYTKFEKWTKEECDRLLHVYNVTPRGSVRNELVKNFPNRTRTAIICKLRDLLLKDKELDNINDTPIAVNHQPSPEPLTNGLNKGFKKMEIRQDHIRLYF